MKQKWISFFQIFLPLILGSIVGFLIQGSMDFDTIQKPFLAPPKILFPIAWTILYFLMGFAYYLYREKSDFDQTSIIHYLQLFVNLLWPIVFFVFKWRFVALLILLLLVFLVFLLMQRYFRQNKICGYLIVPYFLWVCFATYLNIGIVLLN